MCVSKISSSPCSDIIANLYVDVTPGTMVSRMDDNKTSQLQIDCTVRLLHERLWEDVGQITPSVVY